MCSAGENDMTCLFCKIINSEVPADIVHQDDQVIAFRDISPQAPNHVLVIPKKHIATLNDAAPEDAQLLGHLMLTGASLAEQLGCSVEGYRVVMNCNAAAGQTVFHIHLHLLCGRNMHWPPG
jgi:histidine triad (HIT) family protein